jgi:hypothetical protein
MPNFRVIPKVTVANKALVAGPARMKLKVPPGVAAYEPIAVTFGEMSKLERTKMPPPAGLTTAQADVEVPGVEKVGSGTAVQWKFTGGDIILNVEIAVYIIKQYAAVPALFKLIMDHEYLHVADYQNLAKTQITRLLDSDRTLKPWLAGDLWSGSDFYDRVQEVWGLEAKRLGDVLDSGAKYESHKREIAKLAPRI